MKIKPINPKNLPSKDINPIEYAVSSKLYSRIINDENFSYLFWRNIHTQYPGKEIILVVHD